VITFNPISSIIFRVDVQTSEVDAIPPLARLAQQWVRISKQCWATQEYNVVKQSAKSLEPIVEEQWDWKVFKDTVGREGLA
jgi:hypothetical protein